MTADYSTLNCSNSGCLIIGLKQQPIKIHNSSFSTCHSARNPGCIVMNVLLSLIKYLVCLQLAFPTFSSTSLHPSYYHVSLAYMWHLVLFKQCYNGAYHLNTHRTALTIFPFILQTVAGANMMSIEGNGYACTVISVFWYSFSLRWSICYDKSVCRLSIVCL